MRRTHGIGLALMCALAAAFAASCSKPLASARVQPDVVSESRDYAALPNDIYYATRWSLVTAGYAVASENLQEGIITTTWVPVTSDSHPIPTFGRNDYGVTNSYHQLEVQIVPGDGRTTVKVGSRLKTLVSRQKSSGIEERKILDGIGAFLRKEEPSLTNLGVGE